MTSLLPALLPTPLPGSVPLSERVSLDVPAAVAATVRALVERPLWSPRRLSVAEAASEIRGSVGWLLVGRSDQVGAVDAALGRAGARWLAGDLDGLALLWRWADVAEQVHGAGALEAQDWERLEEVLKALEAGVPVDWIAAFAQEA